MSIAVKLSNLGPLRSAELELSDLVLLIGENNSGKTFLATVLHRVLDTTSSRPWGRHRPSGDAPPLLRDWLTRVADDPDEAAAESDIGPPSGGFVLYIATLAAVVAPSAAWTFTPREAGCHELGPY